MVVKTEEVRDLADFRPEGYLVTSFFLNVDAAQFPSDDLLDTSFDSLIHDAESRRKDVEEGLSHEATESIRSDLAKIRELYESGIDRDDTKGVAIFSCAGMDFWQVIQMPTPVDNRVEFGPGPYLAPIAAFISHAKATAVLVTDKQHARIFTMKAGDVREWTDFEDYVPQRSEAGGWSQMRFQRRSDNWRKHHVDHAADLTLKLLQHYPFDWLIIGAEVQTAADLLESLHPYLKDRLIGQIDVRIDADAQEIVDKARELRERVESEHINTLMQQIQEYAGAGGRGTIGLDDTLRALNEQKVHILLLQSGYAAPGTECPNCGILLAGTNETCPACAAPARAVDNIVDAAIQKAIELGSTVEVATELEQLSPIENIGAILYY